VIILLASGVLGGTKDEPLVSKTPTTVAVVEMPTDTAVPPTDTEVPPTDTAVPATDTEVPPTDTAVPPTDTAVPPTDTEVPPTDTEAPPTDTAVPPTDTEVPPTDTEAPPTDTAVPATDTEVPPTDTAVPPTDTEVPPTDTEAPPTDTAVPATDTEVPPTDTAVPPTDTEVPPTDTEVPPTNTPSITSTPMITPESSDEPQVLLRYDGRTLVLFNRAEEDELNILNLSFVQETEEGDIVFRADEWEFGTGDLRAMRPHDCYQVWTLDWINLPLNKFPSEICVNRQGIFQTSRSFWIGAELGLTFEVRRGSQVLAVCQTAEEDIEVEIRCAVDIRP
jgi:hypothetical protein